MKLTEIIALSIRSEINALKQSSQVTMAGISVSKNEQALQKMLFLQDPQILFVGVYNKSFESQTKIFNSASIQELGISNDELEKTIRQNREKIKVSFQDTTVLLNSSSGFNKPMLAVSFPFQKETTSSVIVIIVRLEKFLEAFQTSGITETFLVNDEGKVIAHHDISMILSETNLSNSPIVQKMRTSPLDNGQFRYTGDDGKWHLGSFKKIGIGGAGIIATVLEEKAFEEVYNIQRRNIYLMISALNFAIIVVFFFARKISGPLLNLVVASKKIESGNYHLELVPETRDEIGILTNSFQSMSRGLEEREKLKVSFGKFVNEEIAELSMRGELKVGGDKKNCAILFSDIRSFTSISEKLRAEEVVEFLNEYMGAMVSCVKNNNGYVDKFIGDAIMATWGALKPNSNPSRDAVHATLAMRSALMQFNSTRGTAKKPILHIGIGLNYGAVISGQIGSQDKMEFTVIGDAVNIASRVEGLTKEFGVDIIVSETIYEATKKDFSFVSLQQINVKGKAKPIQVYAVLGAVDDPNCPKDLKELRDYIGYKEPKK